ncbi:hypothetical protein [Streptosporangium pseudovulgare]|uniref:Uncharacterized protein n=1 Tax=Streptosporangium pseudovulgare TaxID=35765 RepID=A0ABQ2R4H8_9ACTN|nr:hypothetical protein [Streptosporangium pseudovulgare]GGQ13383.1 hypothetical protein GCM10010140_49370 [Streptosporangium pseudovulgare]
MTTLNLPAPDRRTVLRRRIRPPVAAKEGRDAWGGDACRAAPATTLSGGPVPGSTASEAGGCADDRCSPGRQNHRDVPHAVAVISRWCP